MITSPEAKPLISPRKIVLQVIFWLAGLGLLASVIWGAVGKGGGAGSAPAATGSRAASIRVAASNERGMGRRRLRPRCGISMEALTPCRC